MAEGNAAKILAAIKDQIDTFYEMRSNLLLPIPKPSTLNPKTLGTNP